MNYVILKDNIVQQVQNMPLPEDKNHVSTEENVVCGQVYDEKTGKFNNPPTEELPEVKKEVEILEVATITDQLNLIAGILMEMILAKPEEERTDLEKQGLEVAGTIQSIRTK